MGIYQVHNLKQGSSPVPSGCSSWIDYWEKATGLEAGLCHRRPCLVSSATRATDGAHVQLDTPDDDRWWIVPLCHKCNTQPGDHFDVEGPLVSVIDPKIILP